MSATASRGTLALALQAARPRQWLKNLACLAGVVFSGKLTQPRYLACAFGATIAFSLVSSAGYLVNDIIDRDRDRLNPRTRNRPLASGALSVAWAMFFVFVFYSAGILLGGFLGGRMLAVLAVYIALGSLYSLTMKNRVLLDVFAISFGFVLRLLGGVFAVGEKPTAWIVLCMLFLALFLGFAKRRAELSQARGESLDRRPVLRAYTEPFLDALLQMTGAITILTYALFTVASHRNHSLVVTVPFVAYGILHYLHQVIVRGHGESPEELFLSDRSLFATALLWLLASIAILYWDLRLFD